MSLANFENSFFLSCVLREERAFLICCRFTILLVEGIRTNYHYLIQLNLSTTATLGTEESGRCGEVAVMGR